MDPRSRIITFCLLASLCSLSQAQVVCPTLVDITVVPDQNDQLEIRLRPHEAFDGYFASLVFTLRWMDGEANLGTMSQELMPYFSLGTSGPEHVDGIYRYQIYAGFGGAQQLGEAAGWEPWEEVLLTRISVLNGNSFFEIVQNEWTAANNGDYYISLNGIGCEDANGDYYGGDIYTITTDVTMAEAFAPEITVAPNPNAGMSMINVVLADQADLNFELFDPAGRRVWQQARPSRIGQHVEQLAMEHLANGVYLLQVRIGDRLSTHRVVLAGGM